VDVTVYVPTPYRHLTGGSAHITIALTEGADLTGLVDAFDAAHPGIRSEIWDGDDFRHYINVYLNGEEVRALEGRRTILHRGDEVAFVPMLAGGSEEVCVMTRRHYDDIVAHARSEFPNECCGLLSGKDLTVADVHRMKNVEASPVLYVMDPREQLRVFDDIDRQGADLVAIYHSHTRSAPYPSATDVRMAFYPESLYVIVSLQDSQRPTIAAFRIVDGQIRETRMEIRDSES